MGNYSYHCSVCDQYSYYADETEYRATLGKSDPCATCNDIYQTYPELAGWVRRVVEHAVDTAMRDHRATYEHERVDSCPCCR